MLRRASIIPAAARLRHTILTCSASLSLSRGAILHTWYPCQDVAVAELLVTSVCSDIVVHAHRVDGQEQLRAGPAAAASDGVCGHKHQPVLGQLLQQRLWHPSGLALRSARGPVQPPREPGWVTALSASFRSAQPCLRRPCAVRPDSGSSGQAWAFPRGFSPGTAGPPQRHTQRPGRLRSQAKRPEAGLVASPSEPACEREQQHACHAEPTQGSTHRH